MLNFRRNKPTFLGIGAQKAGTSWLFANLRQHPGVMMAPWKEVQYFSHIFCEEHRGWTEQHTRRAIGEIIKQRVIHARRPSRRRLARLLRLVDPDYMFTERWYFDVFSLDSAKGRVVGEVSPEYSTIPVRGIDHIKQLLGPVKIIYIVRHPVRRALSQMRMNVQRSGEENPDWLEQAKRPVILNRGDYATYVPRWEAAFGDDLLIIPFGDIATEPAGVIARVESHLNIAPYSGYTGLEKKHHVSMAAQIPADAIAYLDEVLEPQCAFLREHFGVKFFERV